MNKFSKATTAFLAAAVLATGIAATAGSASAAPMMRTAGFDNASNLVEVGFRKGGHRKGHRFHGKRHRAYGYGYGYGHGCFYKRHKVWSPYYGGYHWKKVRVCF